MMERCLTTPWFQARRYGWGSTPVTVEGWIVTALFIVAADIDSLVLIHRLRTGGDGGEATITFLAYLAFLAGAPGVSAPSGERFDQNMSGVMTFWGRGPSSAARMVSADLRRMSAQACGEWNAACGVMMKRPSSQDSRAR